MDLAIDSSRRVEIIFEYTFAELREGIRPPELSRSRPGIRWLRVAVALTLLIVSISLLFFLASGRASSAATPSPPPMHSTSDLYLTLAPSWCAAVIFITLIISAMLRARLSLNASTRRFKSLPPLAAGGVAGLIILLAMGWYGAELNSGATVSWSDPAIVGLSIAPWLVLLVVLFILGQRAARRKLKNRPGLQRRRTMALDDIGLTSLDDMMSSQYRWKYFQRAWETPNVVTLLDENRLGHVIPKRAFASESDLQLARSLIVTHIPDSKLLVQPGGFEVAPPSPQAPLPVMPITSSAPAPDQAQG